MSFSMPQEFYSFATIVTSIVLAFVTYCQYRISKHTLRLDLYNKRFDVYSKTLDFFNVLLTYNPHVGPEEPYREVWEAFLKGVRESKFLFSDESGIYKILNEIHLESVKIYGMKDLINMASTDPATFANYAENSRKALEVISKAIDRLENQMATYLNFHHIAS